MKNKLFKNETGVYIKQHQAAGNDIPKNNRK
jgi:hypothetical protein